MTRKLLFVLFPLLLLVFVATANAQNSTTGSAQATDDSATKLKLQMQLLQDQKKAAVAQVKDPAKLMIQAKRAEFKLKLQTIKDQKKKALVERIDAKLAEVNKNYTTRFTDILGRLQIFLDKVNKSATGTAALADIVTAQDAIDAAKATVGIQAAKSYTMIITDDPMLKLNAGTTVSQFRQDLMAVYKQVIDAKQAVQKLYVDKELIKKEATGSAKI